MLFVKSELLEMQKRSAPPPESVAPEPEILELETQNQEPEVMRDEPEIAQDEPPVLNNGIVLNNSFVPPVNDTQNAPDTPSGENENSVGYLQVQVFVSDRAEPIENAIVVITPSLESDNVPLTFYTDNSGKTPIIDLATVSASLSQQPEDFSPFSTYDITTSASGYFTIQNKNLPVFDGQTSLLPVRMIPLPENYSGDEVLVYDESSSEKQL